MERGIVYNDHTDIKVVTESLPAVCIIKESTRKKISVACLKAAPSQQKLFKLTHIYKISKVSIYVSGHISV